MSDQPSNTLVGTRLSDCSMNEWPLDSFEEIPPGSYWRIVDKLTRQPLDVHTLEGQRWWNNTDVYDTRYEQNLTGTVWGVIDPSGNYGMLSIHTVREEDDGTISVRPGDGSSNSILISSPTPDGEPKYHGYIEHGVWSAC